MLSTHTESILRTDLSDPKMSMVEGGGCGGKLWALVGSCWPIWVDVSSWSSCCSSDTFVVSTNFERARYGHSRDLALAYTERSQHNGESEPAIACSGWQALAVCARRSQAAVWPAQDGLVVRVCVGRPSAAWPCARLSWRWCAAQPAIQARWFSRQWRRLAARCFPPRAYTLLRGSSHSHIVWLRSSKHMCSSRVRTKSCKRALTCPSALAFTAPASSACAHWARVNTRTLSQLSSLSNSSSH